MLTTEAVMVAGRGFLGVHGVLYQIATEEAPIGDEAVNCLHQDLYGEEVFPLQATMLLAEPGRDFDGGEFVLTEQRPRRPSRAEVVPPECGDSIVCPVQHRPVEGSRGFYRAKLRTASVGCAPAIAMPSASSSTTPVRGCIVGTPPSRHVSKLAPPRVLQGGYYGA